MQTLPFWTQITTRQVEALSAVSIWTEFTQIDQHVRALCSALLWHHVWVKASNCVWNPQFFRTFQNRQFDNYAHFTQSCPAPEDLQGLFGLLHHLLMAASGYTHVPGPKTFTLCLRSNLMWWIMCLIYCIFSDKLISTVQKKMVLNLFDVLIRKRSLLKILNVKRIYWKSSIQHAICLLYFNISSSQLHILAWWWC